MSSYPSYTPSYTSYYPSSSSIPTASFSQYTNPFYASPPADNHPNPVPDPEPDPTSCITPTLASKAMRRLLSGQLHKAGFDGAQPLALERLQHEVVALVEHIYSRAHECADLSNRSGPTPSDVLLALHEFRISSSDLQRAAHKRPKKRKHNVQASYPKAHTLTLPPPRTPSPTLLPSDDESTPPSIMSLPPTLRFLPPHFPALPAKHTYLRTPILSSTPSSNSVPPTTTPTSYASNPPHPAPKRAAHTHAQTLEKKLHNAALVQSSLKNLLLATDDTAGKEDGELLGYVVNCELSALSSGMGVGTGAGRKRWKVGGYA